MLRYPKFKIFPYGINAPTTKEWDELGEPLDYNTKRQIDDHATLPIDLCAEIFDAAIKCFRSWKQIPANKVKIILGSLEITELTRRIKILIETFEDMTDVPPITLELADQPATLPANETPYLPLFKHISSPQCRIKDLYINMPLSKVSLKLIQLALDGNTSVNKLRLKSATHAWKCLSGLKGPIESIRLYAPNSDASTSKKGLKSLLSLLKRNQKTLTTVELNYDIEEYEKEVLSAMSKISALKRLKWINNKKLSGEAIASVLENNPQLQELILESGCEVTKAQALLKPLTGLCQSHQLRILKLNFDKVTELIPALEDNRSIIKLKISEHALFNAKVLATIGTMKKLKILTVVRNTRFMEDQSAVKGASQDPQDPKTVAQADLTPLIGPNSRIRHLKISNYNFQINDEFWNMISGDTSLSFLETKAPNVGMRQQTSFLAAVRCNPYIDTDWPGKSFHLFNYMIFSMKAKTLLQSLRDGVTLLQTILLAKDRGLFSNIPKELLLAILRYYIGLDLTPAHMITLFELGCSRESLFDNPNMRAKLREIWKTFN